MKAKAANGVDDYISPFPPDVQKILQKVRATIRQAAPGAVEAIKYGIPTFILNGNLVHFAGYKNHIGFYPAPSAIAKFADELAEYKQAKGSVQFPLDQLIPYALIKSIVEFRVRESAASSGKPKK